jgi:hypothetical protein
MGSFLKSLFGTNKKRKKMDNSEQLIQETVDKYSSLDFQWIKGDKLSYVEKYKNVFSNGDFVFIEFQSGDKINVDLVNEYMATFPASDTDFTTNPTPTPKPQSKPPTTQEQSAVTSIIYENEDAKPHQIDSPIYKLLKKQKKNMVEVSIKIKLNLPPKDLYTVLLGSFDEAEKEIIDFVLDGVDIENIKSALAESIKKSYYSHSKSEQEKPSGKKSQEKETTEKE